MGSERVTQGALERRLEGMNSKPLAVKCGVRFLGPLIAALLLSGCSVRKFAVDGLAGALASSGDVFGSDDDPELIRDALPFGLKTMEALMEESPKNRDLLFAVSYTHLTLPTNYSV